jgi:hypothetical protein
LGALVLIVVADAIYRWARILTTPEREPAREAPVVESQLVA